MHKLLIENMLVEQPVGTFAIASHGDWVWRKGDSGYWLNEGYPASSGMLASVLCGPHTLWALY